MVQGRKLVDNLNMGIYKEAVQYLIGGGEHERGLKASILEKYRVGLGTEKFLNENGHMSGFDSVYFPIYMPRDKKQDKSDKSKNKNLTKKE